MREIDLLPEWYKSNKRRQVSYRSQYIAFCGLLSVMVVWNFVLVHSVSEEERELAQLELKRSQLKSISQKVGGMPPPRTKSLSLISSHSATAHLSAIQPIPVSVEARGYKRIAATTFW